MADTFKGIITADGKKRQLPYRNVLETPASDKTLSVEGGFADSKAVGNKFAKVDSETALIKENLVKNNSDIDNLSSSKISKFYASSQGETHLADSDNGKIMDMMLYGKSEQKQYSGKNLFTFQDGSNIINGITFEAKDGIITAKGTATEEFVRTYFQFTYPKDIFTVGETYTFSINSNDNNLKLYALYKANDTSDYRPLFSVTTKTVTVQIPKNVDLLIRCVVDINTTVNATATIQIEKGSEATSYEPYTGGIPSPNPDYPQEIKSVVNPTVKVTNEDNVKVQSVTFNDVTLYSIPVKDGGNITINGQKYISDYIDIENRKIVKFVKKLFLKQIQWPKAINKGVIRFYASTIDAVGIGGDKVIKNAFSISSHFAFVVGTPDRIGTFTANADGTNANIGFAFSTDTTTSSDDFNNWILNNNPFVLLPVLKEELPLTSEQILALKELSTYYPVTNISINSEQLDGYTVFNYPISMQNGWNYVKQQIGDTREYIYDIDARTQDTDLQAAEAYVNSEYAVALTELEV